MYTLLIDYREKSIINLFIEKFGISSQTDEENVIEYANELYTVIIKNLPLADFIYKDDSGNDLLLIERKTKGDLISSIIDGRFRDQKSRLTEFAKDPKNIMYLIESPSQMIKRGECNKTNLQTIYHSSIINMQYKHQFKLFISINVDESFEILLLLLKKLKNKELETIESNPDRLESVKPKTKSENIHENLFAYQLSLIQGVSTNIAKKVCELYKTPMGLCMKYSELNDQKECESLLKDIQITDKRKLGLAISKKIYKAMIDGC